MSPAIPPFGCEVDDGFDVGTYWAGLPDDEAIVTTLAPNLTGAACAVTVCCAVQTTAAPEGTVVDKVVLTMLVDSVIREAGQLTNCDAQASAEYVYVVFVVVVETSARPLSVATGDVETDAVWWSMQAPLRLV